MIWVRDDVLIVPWYVEDANPGNEGNAAAFSLGVVKGELSLHGNREWEKNWTFAILLSELFSNRGAIPLRCECLNRLTK